MAPTTTQDGTARSPYDQLNLPGLQPFRNRLDYFVNLADGPGPENVDDTGPDVSDDSEALIPMRLPESPPLSMLLAGSSKDLPNQIFFNRTTGSGKRQQEFSSGSGGMIPDSKAGFQPLDMTGLNGSSTDTLFPKNNFTKQYSNRRGALQTAEDGQQRFFGASSNLHLLHPGPSALYRPHMLSAQTHGSSALERAGITWETDLEYEKQLLSSFFAWDNPLLNAVDEAQFQAGKQCYHSGMESELYSEALENAMSAVGALYFRQRHAAISGSVSAFFALRAETLLQIELESPAIATIQTLLVLCSYRAAEGRDSGGWLYSGMAVRLLYDLGLHINPEDGSHHSTMQDLQIRQNLYNAVYCLDTLWQSWCGRSTTNQLSSFDKYWSSNEGISPNSHRCFTPIEKLMEPVAGITTINTYLTRLMVIFRKILEVLYSDTSKVKIDLQEFANKMNSSLQRWNSSLPAELLLKSPDGRQQICPANLLQLHMQYHEVVILLYRGFLRPTGSVPSAQEHASAFKAYQTCLSSAKTISNLLGEYQQRFGFGRSQVYLVHISMTSSLFHVYNSFGSHAREDKLTTELLLASIQNSHEIAETFNSGIRALEVITSVRRDWQNELAKINEQQSSKRRRTSSTA